ncbi:MAG: aminodeoxychorismate synthase component I [Desulfocapsaceae bacterium]
MTFSVLTDKQIGALLASLAEHEQYVFLDTSMPDRLNNRSLLFTRPLSLLQHRQGQNRADFLEEAAGWLDRGYYLAGWIGYEFLHDELSLRLAAAEGLLAELGVYPPPALFDHSAPGAGFEPPVVVGTLGEDAAQNAYRLDNLQPAIEQQQYCRAVRDILEYIAAGDTYQVNYTFKMHFDFEGSVVSLYRNLRRSQPVPYGCCIKNGERYTLSFSPELFFKMEPDRIIARPMKGTAARGRNTIEDKRSAHFLKNDVKNRSENVMIVDLLRNDLSRLVDGTGGGTVDVDSLFDVERYRTVLQMTSTVVARRRQNSRVTPAQILQAIFPCGSVTGAPKIRTMEIIDELESQPRGVYTGAVGYFSPDGAAQFNVPIRTLVVDGKRGEMGIGSGIVADSSPEDEWRECLLKARFLSHPPPPFQLFETMLYHPRSGYLLLYDHLQRLEESAQYFGFLINRQRIADELNRRSHCFEDNSCMRVRLVLESDGRFTLEATPCPEPRALSLAEQPDLDESQSAGEMIDFADEQTMSSSRWLFHKTTRREQYDRFYRKAAAQGLFDFIFCNERGEVTEGCISNLVVRLAGRYFTPPQESGLLAGAMRRQLLQPNNAVQVKEKVLYREDLERAEAIFLCNSVRGIVRVRLRG